MFERIVGQLHLPYPLACLIFAMLLGAPGFLVIEVLRTSNWDEAARLVFSLPAGVTWEAVLSAGPFILVDLLVFLGIRGMRTRLVSAKDDLVPLCPAGEATYRHAFRYTGAIWPAIIALGLETISGLSLALAGGWDREGLYLFPFEVLRFLVTLGILTFVWVYATGLLGLYEVGKLPLRLRSYREDTLLGTRPIGQLSLRFAFTYFVILVLVLVANSFAPDAATPWIVVGLAIIGVTMFFLPLSSIHRKMIEAKRRELSSVRAHFAQLMGDRKDADASLLTESIQHVDRRLRDLTNLQILDMELRETGNIRTWPFDTRILGQLTVIVLSVTAALIARLLVNALRL